MGFDETTVDVEGGDDQVGIKNTGMDKLTVRGNGLLARWYELPSGLVHQRHEGGTWASPLPLGAPLLVGDLLPYMVFALVNSDPTLVSHPYPHLCACPISYSF